MWTRLAVKLPWSMVDLVKLKKVVHNDSKLGVRLVADVQNDNKLSVGRPRCQEATLLRLGRR